MLAPYSEGHHDSLLKLGLASLALYDGFVERLRAETRCEFEYERSGTLQVAIGEVEATRLTAEANGTWPGASHCEWIDRSALRKMEPALGDGATAGMLLPIQGYVDAPAITRALADAAQRRGAHFSAERVLGIHD